MTSNPPSAVAQAARIAVGEATSAELVDAALERIAVTDGDLRAFVHVDADRARAEARALDDDLRAGRTRGPLHGVPVAVKDIFDVTGEVTTAGSLVPAGPPADADATAVRRLREAGAVVVGRTRTHEFAWGLTTRHPVLGGAHNPHDHSRVTGGSSGGSAAAVAAGVVSIALGTDTAGSIRVPAAWCGVVGHKPTWGLVPADGVVPLAPTFDHVGALTSGVDDARLALSVLTGSTYQRLRHDARGLRVGLVRSPAHVVTGRAAAAAVQRVADALADDGAEVRLLDLPDPFELAGVFLAIQSEEALTWHRATGRWPAHAGAYAADVAERLRAAEDLDLSAAALLPTVRAAVSTALADVDVVVMPVSASGPSTVDDPNTVDIDGTPADLRLAVLAHTLLASVCGLPACAVPGGTESDGMPLGLQVVGAAGADALVLDVAQLVEEQQPSRLTPT